MAVSIFTRSSFRRFIGISNNVTVSFLDFTQYLNTKSRAYSISNSEIDNLSQFKEKNPIKKISKVMMAYLKRSKEYEEFMKKEIVEYQIGKRHLANMMGINPEFFTQEDINKSIEYLFPSGLYDRKARPMMRHPDEIFPSKKAAEFDKTGKPFHSMFYTAKPNYYEVLHNILGTIESLNKIEDSLIKQGTIPMDKIDLVGSAWLTKKDIEDKIIENLHDIQYDYLITSLNRLSNHSLSNHAKDFIMKYCKKLSNYMNEVVISPLELDSTGRPYITVTNCMRKSARGTVTVWGNGTGKITVNGQDITYFKDMHYRKQIVFPLIFTNMIDKVDIEATITGGGPTGQSGAMRWGIAWGLRSFVDKPMVEKMRVAGLLTKDWRIRERKKWGQKGARRKFTWHKR